MNDFNSRNRKTPSRIAHNKLLDEVAQQPLTVVGTKTGPGDVSMDLNGRRVTKGRLGFVITAPGHEYVVSRTTLADLACRGVITIQQGAAIDPLRTSELELAKRRRDITK
jgi:hypothetical protein